LLEGRRVTDYYSEYFVSIFSNKNMPAWLIFILFLSLSFCLFVFIYFVFIFS